MQEMPELCIWCGMIGRIHKSDCKAFFRNYKTSLDVQRETTERLRADAVPGRILHCPGPVEYVSDRPRSVAVLPSMRAPPQRVAVVQDTRTEVQKRFDAIAEELADGDGKK